MSFPIHRPKPVSYNTSPPTFSPPPPTTPRRTAQQSARSEHLSPQSVRPSYSSHNTYDSSMGEYVLPRPPSRSERSLRDALRKNEARVAQVSSNPSSPASPDSRNPAAASTSTTSPYMFRTPMTPQGIIEYDNASVVSSPKATKPQTRRGVTYVGADGLAAAVRRSKSPTPAPSSSSASQAPGAKRARTRDSNASGASSPSHTNHLPVTPHEAVLRARLERVLKACENSEVQERKRERVRGMSRSPPSQSAMMMPPPPLPITARDRSASPARARESASNGWPWSPALPPTASDVRPIAQRRSRSQSIPAGPPSLENSASMSLPTREPLILSHKRKNSATSGRCRSPPRSPSAFYRVPAGAAYYDDGISEKDLDPVVEGQSSRMLTPPPTPPMDSSRRLSLDGVPIPNSNPRTKSTNPHTSSMLLSTSAPSTKRGLLARSHTVPQRGSSGSYFPPAATHTGSPSSLASSSPSESSSGRSKRPHSSSSSQSSSTNSLPGLSSGQSSPKFDAQSALAQCREIEGYVSFSAIEGLGVPEGFDMDGKDDDTAEKKPQRHGFWRVFSS